MKNLFEHTSSPWIRYSSYEYRTAEDGTLYIVVSADAKPEMYNPMKDAESLVLDAVNIGLQVMHKAPEDELKSMVLRFINSYGFLGFMTALPTTAEFITYESVYLPKNHFIINLLKCRKFLPATENSGMPSATHMLMFQPH